MRSTRLIQYAVILGSALIGGGSLVLFMIFVYGGSFDWVRLGLDEPFALAVDALLCLVFFIQHSTMIRRSFKDRLGTMIPRVYHGAVYSIASGIVLLALVIFWQGSARMIYSLPDALAVGGRAVYFGAIGLFAWGCLALGSVDFFGVQPIIARLKGTPPTNMPFTVRGPFRWVRHPLYLAMLLAFWSCPAVSLDRLMFNITWTLWTVLATVLEERDLVHEFGDDYRAYQRKVPMLIPRHVRPPM